MSKKISVVLYAQTKYRRPQDYERVKIRHGRDVTAWDAQVRAEYHPDETLDDALANAQPRYGEVVLNSIEMEVP